MVYNTGETSEELKMKYNPEGSDLRKAQLRMLDMLNYIDGICKKLNIQYRIDGGTCLGAVRHKGFIPWDDDLDLAFNRKDWEILVHYLVKNPHRQYIIQCHKTDPGYLGAWAVLRDTKSEYIQESKIHNARNFRGLQIDLFPFDVGNIVVLQRIAELCNRRIINYLINKDKLKIANCVWHFCYQFLFPLFRLFNVFGDKNFSSHSYGSSWFKKDRNYMKLDEVLPYRTIEFEGSLYPGPANPTKVLERLYGNFQELPSVDNRDWHKADYRIWD